MLRNIPMRETGTQGEVTHSFSCLHVEAGKCRGPEKNANRTGLTNRSRTPLIAALVTWLYRHCIRPALFSKDSEAIHDFTMKRLAQISRHEVLCEMVESFCGAPELPVEVFG